MNSRTVLLNWELSSHSFSTGTWLWAAEYRPTADQRRIQCKGTVSRNRNFFKVYEVQYFLLWVDGVLDFK
jgi:hypothetical protein